MATILKGCSILVVEDDPLVAEDIIEILKCAGASALVARRASDAVKLAGEQRLDAAVVDWAFGDNEAETVCKQLDQFGLPYVIYSGLPYVMLASLPTKPTSMLAAQPAAPEQLINAVGRALRADAY